MGRGDVDRAAFIILLSDGGDPTILEDKEWERTSTSVLKDPKYPVHTFGFYGHDPDTLRYIAKRTKGTYTGIDIAGTDNLRWFAGAFAGLLDNATTRLFNAVGTRTDLTSAHPGVSLSRIDSGAQKATIAGDGRSGAVDVGAVSAGETREFTVYLDVPQGDADADNMDLLAVGGVYTQGWDGRQVELNRSVVFVSRPAPPPSPPPPPPCSCKELEWIEERLEYWCKVKLELSAMYDKAEAEAAGGNSAECNCKCQCMVTAVLREASAEAINRAMYQDVFTVRNVYTLLVVRC